MRAQGRLEFEELALKAINPSWGPPTNSPLEVTKEHVLPPGTQSIQVSLQNMVLAISLSFSLNTPYMARYLGPINTSLLFQFNGGTTSVERFRSLRPLSSTQTQAIILAIRIRESTHCPIYSRTHHSKYSLLFLCLAVRFPRYTVHLCLTDFPQGVVKLPSVQSRNVPK